MMLQSGVVRKKQTKASISPKKKGTSTANRRRSAGSRLKRETLLKSVPAMELLKGPKKNLSPNGRGRGHRRVDQRGTSTAT